MMRSISRAHRAQIAILHRAVDVEHALHVVVRHDAHLLGALDGGHVARISGCAACRRR